jgi:hypothetical protein
VKIRGFPVFRQHRFCTFVHFVLVDEDGNRVATAGICIEQQSKKEQNAWFCLNSICVFWGFSGYGNRGVFLCAEFS